MDSFFIKPGTAHTLSSNRANGSKSIDTRINSRPQSSRGGRGGMNSRGGGRGGSMSSRGGRGGMSNRGGSMSSRGGRGGMSNRGGRGGFNNRDNNNRDNSNNKGFNNKRKNIPKDEYYDSDKSSDEQEQEPEESEEESDNENTNEQMEFHSEDEDDFKQVNAEESEEESEDEEVKKARLKKKLKLSVVEEEETADEKRLRLANDYINKIRQVKEDLDLDEAVREDLDKSSGRYQYSYREQISKLKLKDLIKNSNNSNNNINKRVTVFKGHSSPITCIVLSEDQTIAYSASKDLIIQWDLINKTKLKKIKGFLPSKNNRYEIDQLKKQEKEEWKKTTYQGRVLAMALSFDGKYLVTGGEEKLIKVWDTETMTVVETFKGHKDIISALSFRKGTYQLYSGSHDRTVKIWDLTQMAFVDTRYGHQSPITAIDALTRERCITVSTDKTCRVWKIPEESQLIFRGHTHSVDCCALVSEEKFITGSQEGSIALWNVNKKNATFIKNNAHPNTDLPWITSVAAIPNSDIVASGSSDGVLRLWAIMGGEKLREINTIEVDGFINDMKFSRDCSFILAAIAQEHKLGRWKRVKTAKNSLLLIDLTSNIEEEEEDLNSENTSEELQEGEEEDEEEEQGEVEEVDDDEQDDE
ncbi:hypothetical protein DICPUDRAFT_93771 [Dictyostelium purpureum]|uniref:Uncharacterized protein n=1 Tax=Dictyostelium purpureum TaxID=5786 RepID=F0ZBD9_DICPU|nr:uncharacterized protein DICPUDRAFT_93771 [Dictyostelium purpureum]EGC38729.1 hypothetical protein DICPUDRAFT_93771 [Dictyostelium purpureum]|eukprot:XP_003284720.1 hypothetical protein DICPUDRAFT_93771 [Dictyostelium purpureum]